MGPRPFVAAVAGAAVALVSTLALSAPAAPALDASPTVLAKQAKALGITKGGSRYRFHKVRRTSDTLLIAVELPNAWSDTADSHFIHPDSNKPYGVGVRATTNAEKFHTSFAVPGVKVTATADPATFVDTKELVANNAFKGCRNGSVAPFDNGTYQGTYQVFDRCGRNRAAAVVVGAMDAALSKEILVGAQVLTKADLAAIDRVLATTKIQKTSV
jgi:serine protease Do